MTLNPYEAPRAQVADIEPAEQQQLATRLQRFANVAIDWLVFLLLMAIMLFVGESVSTGFLQSVATDRVTIIVLMTTFYSLFEFFLEQTPGKLLTGTRVVTDTGGTPGFQQCLVRSVVRFVPFESFSFLGEPPVGWHDRWSRTRVIRIRRSSTLDGAYDLRPGKRRSAGAWQPEPETRLER